jgi:hypothetical protein
MRTAVLIAVVAVIGFWVLSLAVCASAQTNGQVVVNPGRYGPYYHLRIELTAKAVDFALSDKAIRSGGQFEIRLRPEYFPVPAPRCKTSLILRMPWTAPETAGAEEKVAAKRALLQRILALEKDSHASVPVVIELNPYVEVTNHKPLRLRLNHCNVFFRQAFGAYVDHTEPVTNN